MASNRVKCSCGAILTLPEHLPTGTFTCSQCGQRLALGRRAVTGPVPSVKKPAPGSRAPLVAPSAPGPQSGPATSRSLLLRLAIGGGAAVLLTLVSWLVWHGFSPALKKGEQDRQTKVTDKDKEAEKPSKRKAAQEGSRAETTTRFEPLALDTSFVTGDFGAALVVSPGALLQAPWGEKLLPPQWRTLMSQQIGTDLKNIDQIVLLAEKPAATAEQSLPDLTKYQPKLAMTLKGQPFDFSTVTFSTDGRWVLTAGGPVDGQVRIYDPRRGTLIRSLPRMEGAIRDFALTPDNKQLALTSLDKPVRLWSFQTNSAKLLSAKDANDFETVAVSPDGRLLAASGRHSSICLFDLPDGKARHTLKGHTKAVTQLTFAQDGKTLASYGEDNRLKLWDAVAGKELSTPVQNVFANSMAMSPDGKLVALADFNNRIRLVELPSGKEIKQLTTKSSIRSLAFRSDGKVLASGGGGFDGPGEIKLWQVPEGNPLYNLEGHKRQVDKVAFSADGQRLATVGQDPYVQLWAVGPNAEPGNEPNAMATIVRLKDPKDSTAIIDSFLGSSQKTTVGDKTYIVSKEYKMAGDAVAAHLVDERTVLVARQATLTKMLAGKKESTPFVERLRKLPAGEAQLVIWVEPLRKMLAEAAKEISGDLPPPLTAAIPLLEQLQFVQLSLHLQNDTLAQLTLEMADDKSAGRLHQALQEGVAFGKALYPKLRESFAFQVPPDVLALADEVYDLKPAKEGANVTVRIPRPTLEALPPELIASSGFNDAKGMHADRIPDSPFPLGTNNRVGGMGEPGWDGPWSAHAKIRYQSKDVFEGDGAVHVLPVFAKAAGVLFTRRLAAPLTETFQITQYIKIPPQGAIAGYITDGKFPQNLGGPIWSAEGENFGVLDGDERGAGKGIKLGRVDNNKWHKVTVNVDPKARKWEFLVDDRKVAEGLGYRFPIQIQALTYLSEWPEGFYLDAVRITRYTGKVGTVMVSTPPAQPKDIAKTPKKPPEVKAPLSKPTEDTPKAPLRPADWPATRVATAGFNDAKGMNADPLPDSPYPLGKNNVTGGGGEFGWAGPWNVHEKITYQTKEVFEGDGAAHVLPRIPKSYGMNLARRWSAPLAEPFEVTQHVKIPPQGAIAGYITNGESNNLAGPVWSAEGGHFGVLDGDEKGGGNGIKLDKVDSTKWHKVTVKVDPQKRKWDFWVDDKQVREGIGFRFPVQRLQMVDYLSEWPDGFFLDAVVIEKLQR